MNHSKKHKFVALLLASYIVLSLVYLALFLYDLPTDIVKCHIEKEFIISHLLILTIYGNGFLFLANCLVILDLLKGEGTIQDHLDSLGSVVRRALPYLLALGLLAMLVLSLPKIAIISQGIAYYLLHA